MKLHVDAGGSEPPYEQIRRQIAAGANDGTFAAGHKLPTVRQLATDLGLAANTVAKAYRALEVDGVTETHGRRGTFVASRQATDPHTDDAGRAFAQLARRQGLSLEEAVRLVEKHWA